MLRPVAIAGIGVLLMSFCAHAIGAEGNAEGLAFFEAKIRPVLVKECYACHSAEAKKLKGGLRLDTRESVLKGGDTGPALAPGKPEESLILEALRHDGLAMPPRGKLPDAVVANFEHWIKMGAPDPRVGKAAPVKAGIDLDSGRKFWSYQPPRRHTTPVVKDPGWCRNEIDGFVLARLEAQGLRPVGDADKIALARRVSYDLIGLPLAPGEVDAFVNDDSPAAYEQLVDRLLASPQFGERWGRHWLDVARFGESLTLRGLIFKEAWRYRDYVINAFNADLPFDRFVREQIAGDLLTAETVEARQEQMIATTFLALGNNNLEEQDKGQLRMDVVDEQLDTIGKAFLAQTIGCARCHDHKFDPIPTRDYYALAGILRNAKAMEHANVSQWIERPLPLPTEQEALYQRHEKAVAELEGRIKTEQTRLAALGVKPGKARGAIAAGDLPGIVVDDTQAKKVGQWQESRFVPTFVGNGYLHDMNTGKGEKSLTFQPELPEAGVYEVRLSYTADTNRASAVPVTILSADGEKTVCVNMRTPPPIDGCFVSLGRFRFERSNQGYVLVSNEGTDGTVIADAVVFLAAEPVGKVPASPKARDVDDQTLKRMEAELKKLRASGPKRPMVMSVLEESQIGDTRVHIRGSVHTLGEAVPRGFLRVASGSTQPTLPSGESGRRELADWLAGQENPLAARVIVNRVWHWLFGAGLVRTTDNFGTTGELPSHPELLDDLAVRFVGEGWSIKTLIRRIVLSRTYQLSTQDQSRALAADPENRLLWRMNHRRLDAECLRDTMLAVSAQLKQEMSGATFPAELAADYGFKHSDTRRSIYAPVFRNALPEFLEVCDMADPSMVVGRRNVSTVAPQALFLMNHPFVIEQARAAAARLLSEPVHDDEERIVLAYRRTLGRPPSEAEARLARKFLEDGRGESLEANWALIFQALFGSMDFRYSS